VASFEFLQVQKASGLATITLNRPPVNVLNIAMMAELNAALEPFIRDTDVAAMVLRAQGKAFCAGVDVGDHTKDKIDEMLCQFHGIFRTLAQTDALTIAVVDGVALGGGCELATFCDVVLASERAKLGQPEVQVGVLPPVAACVLPARVGLPKAIELNAVGTVLGAAEAQRVGLVDHVYRTEEFGLRVEAYLHEIGKLSRPVVRLAKRATAGTSRTEFLARLDEVEQIYRNELAQLADAEEGLAAFLAKRPPVWKHA
jgi:cyclohexa-1,5-dienecarbonyl-CoA hydratase